MAVHLICHAIGSAGSYSAGRMIEAAELAFCAISDNRPALFASQYQALGQATGEFRAPTFAAAG
jgi:hypothetical protein